MSNEFKSKGLERDTIINLIHKKLNEIEFISDNKINIAIEIERGCFGSVIDKCKLSPEAYVRDWENNNFVNMYSSRCAIILSKIEKNSFMIKKLISGEWKSGDIGYKTADELDPESSAETKELIEKRRQIKVIQKESNMYKCPKCGQRKHTPPFGKQTRSLDEEQTQFVTCLVSQCGHKFRVT